MKSPKDSSFYKVYQKNLEKSFVNMQSFDAVRAFLQLDKAAFWANRGHIPDDTICKVSSNEFKNTKSNSVTTGSVFLH